MKLTALILLPLMLTAAPKNVVIDTDAGSDDLMAIAFLLSRKDVNVEAITVANGLAHVPAGAKNLLRLLQLAGRESIPVYLGRETPLEGSNEFPDQWRVIADALPRVNLPSTDRLPSAVSALDFLRARLRNPRRPVSILALGPLTNLAEVLNASPNSVLAIDDLVVMGGAVRVPGNLPDGGTPYSEYRTAEWNFYVDPAAAAKVLQSVTKCRLVPLDASNTVPLDLAFAAELEKAARSKLGQFTYELLGANRILMEQHIFYAWDPLAAAALVTPAVVKISSVGIEVIRAAPEEGRTAEAPTGRMLRVALGADAALFRKVFLDALR